MKTRERTQSDQPSAPRAAAAAGVRHRVLIAEDHTILRDGLRALLSSAPEL